MPFRSKTGFEARASDIVLTSSAHAEISSFSGTTTHDDLFTMKQETAFTHKMMKEGTR
jgi:hypothetical protein